MNEKINLINLLIKWLTQIIKIKNKNCLYEQVTDSSNGLIAI